MRSLLVDAGRAAIRREAIAFGLLATIVTVAVGIGSLVAVDSNLPSAIDSALSATVARSLSPISGMMVGFLIASIITPIIIVVGVIPLVGVYTPVRGIEYENVDTVEHEDSPESGSTRGVRSVSVAWVHTLRNSGITLVGGMLLYVVAAIVVGLLAAIALHAAVFSILTAIGFIAYGFGADQLLGPRRVFHLSGVLVGLGAVIGMFSVRFFDCFACYTDTGSVGSIRESLRFAVTSPGTFAGYVLASSVVFALPIIPIVALLESRPVIAVPVTLAVMYGCFAFFGSFHAIVFERRVLPAVGATPVDDRQTSASPAASSSAGGHRYSVPQRALVSNPLHLVLIVLLVTALLLGSATIRAYDVRPIDSPDQPGPVDASMDPDEILTMASVPLGETSYLEMDTTRVYNNSTSEWEPSVTFEFRFDIEDRQAKVTMYFYDDGDRELDNTVYGSTSQFARAFTYEPRPETRDPPSAASWYMDYQDRWTVRAVPGYYLFGEEPRTISADFFDQEWTVADETDDEVILHAEGADIVLPSGPSSEPLEEASSLEVRVDRETGYVSSIVFERHYAEEDRSIREERTFEEWETYEIDQPEELETVGPLEWAWRVAYY